MATNKMKYDGLTFEVRRLDEQEAEGLIASLPEFQRRCRQRNYRSIKDALTNGDWEFLGDPIRLCEDGALIDGQHRVKAMVATGIYPEVLIISGFKGLDVYKSLDTGTARTCADYFKAMGVTNAVANAATAAASMLIAEGKMRPTGGGGNTPAGGFGAVLEHYEAEGEDLYSEVRSLLASVRQMIGAGSLAAGVVVRAKVCGGDMSDITTFVRSLESGVGRAKSPVLLLRRQLVVDNNRLRKSILPKLRGFLFAKALSLHLKGESKGVLKIGEREPIAFGSSEEGLYAGN